MLSFLFFVNDQKQSLAANFFIAEQSRNIQLKISHKGLYEGKNIS